MHFADSLALVAIDLNLKADSPIEVLEALVRLASKSHPFAAPNQIVSVLIERENLSTTGIGGGIAVPHCKTEQADRLIMAFGRAPGGVEFKALDRKPVQLFFLLLAPIEAANTHLKALAKIARFAKDSAVIDSLLNLESPQAVHQFLAEQSKG